MNSIQEIKTDEVLTELFKDSKNDMLKIIKGAARSIFRPMQPIDFKNAYLSISKEQGEELRQLIIENKCKNIVEFGTSFGISTLYLAQGALKTNGRIVTTELLESKASKAMENFRKAGVQDRIEVRVGDAMNTLKNYQESIDLLLLDGWKDLYLALFQMLESNFHAGTIIYVDNADMAETKKFLNTIRKNSTYQLQSKFDGKVVIITLPH